MKLDCIPPLELNYLVLLCDPLALVPHEGSDANKECETCDK